MATAQDNVTRLIGYTELRTDVPGGVPPGGIDGNDTPLLVLTGTSAEIQLTLDTDGVYRPDRDFAGPDAWTLDVNDLGNYPAPALNASAEVDVYVAPVNDAPTITAPGFWRGGTYQPARVTPSGV